MSVARNDNGALEVFARGSDNQLWHTWQNQDGWSDWASLGGDLRHGPTVTQHKGGGLEVFSVAGDGALWHIWQEGGGWTQWVSLGGGLTDSPTAAANHDGHLEVFARGLDGQLWHTWQVPSSGQWSGWYPLGISITGNPTVGRDTAESGLCLFVRGTDGAIYYSRQTVPLVSDNWEPFRPVAGPASTDASIAFSTDGRMEVFYADEQGAIQHFWQIALAESQWSSPISHGGITYWRPAAATNLGGRLEIFHVGTTTRLYNAWQSAPNGGIGDWNDLGLTAFGGFPVAAKNGDQRLEVFGVDDVGNVIHAWQESPAAGPWDSGTLGGSTLGGLGRRIVELGRCSLWEAYYLE